MTPQVVPVKFRAIDEMSGKFSQMKAAGSKFAMGFKQKFAQAGKAAFKFGRQTAVAGAIVAAPFVLMAKQAVNFEEKMSDVGKTTGLEGKELRKFGDQLLAMSTKTRTSIDDLATIAEVGGQLGVPREEMLKFTEAANQFSIALGSDFSGGVEEAVATISKMKTLFKDTRDLDISDAITRSGSAINELGAVGNGTSANISDFALRMGALPDALKGSATSTLAMGAYLEEMGIDSQIASGGLSNLILVAGKELPGFAKQMGITAAEAKQLLATDPTGFAAKFSQSFKGMAPEKLAKKLQKLKIGSQETIKVVGALSSDQLDMATGMTRLATLQGISNKAFDENNSLKTEAAKKEATAAAQMAKLKNNVNTLAISMGQALLPVINDVVEAIMPYIKGAADWISRNKDLASTIAKAAVGIAAFLFAVSAVSFVVGAAQKAMVLFNLVTAAGIGPLAVIVGVIGVAVIAAKALSNAFGGLTHAEELNNEVKSRALEKSVDQRIEVNELFRTLRKAKQGTDEYRAALTRVEEIQPGITEKYDLERASIESLNLAQKELIKTIMQRAEIEAKQEIAKEKLKEAIRLREGGDSSDTIFQSLQRFTGDGQNVDKVKKLEAIQKTQDAERLFSEVEQQKAEAANPGAATAEQMRQFLNITVNVDKDGNQTVTQNSSTGSGVMSLMPKMGTTR